MKLKQPTNGFRYNTDSILLYQFVALNAPKGKVLDVGCGCGVVGLLLARDFGVDLTGIDIQPEMIEFARENASLNGINACFVEGNYLSMSPESKFDLVVSNPPFYHAETLKSQNESLKYARYASSMPIDQMLKQTNRVLSTKGDLFFCYDANFLGDIVRALLSYKYKLKTVQFVHRSTKDPARLVLIHAKKMAIKSTKTLAPIFLHEESEISRSMLEIARKANTQCVA